MAADVISAAGYPVAVYDAMPSPGRKFLLAGVGGMNITHAEPFERFVTRYREAQPWLEPLLREFGADQLRAWVHSLGIETFTGSSRRVFPADMKAAPLLRAWLHRLRQQGVVFFPRHRWLGWQNDGQLRFEHPTETGQTVSSITGAATVLALGGGSWARLGSDGKWARLLAAEGVPVSPLRASNCGFAVSWSEHFRQQCAGEPLNTIALEFTDHTGQQHRYRGEATLAEYGIEGSAIYALSAPLREQILQQGSATLLVDLAPDREAAALLKTLQKPRNGMSFSTFMRKVLRFPAVKVALIREHLDAEACRSPALLLQAIKHLPLTLTAVRPLDEAISSAGGVCQAAVDNAGMLIAKPGVFCAGEMLDWEAPTGGYLLTACFATGYHSGHGVVEYLKNAPQ
jgi:uncharacterized flavoprotein (TIGR03862 family)